jgi:hypothetical protein
VTESFWILPDTANLRTPTTILKEQAEALTQQTGGLLKGEVSLRPAKSGGGHGLTGSIATLTIAVPAIDSYFVTALSYQHGLESYPGALFLNFENRSVEVADESAFTHALRAALSSTKTQNVLSNLLSQAGAG